MYKTLYNPKSICWKYCTKLKCWPGYKRCNNTNILLLLIKTLDKIVVETPALNDSLPSILCDYCMYSYNFDSNRWTSETPLTSALKLCNMYALCRDGPVPPFLGLSCLLLCNSPWLDLPGANDGVDKSTEDVDPGRQPEHRSPALQGVLTTQDEEETSAASYCGFLLCAVRVCVTAHCLLL